MFFDRKAIFWPDQSDKSWISYFCSSKLKKAISQRDYNKWKVLSVVYTLRKICLNQPNPIQQLELAEWKLWASERL